MTTHNLQDYAFAKKMLIEIPKAIEDLEKARAALSKHKMFYSVLSVTEKIEESVLQLGTRLSYFERVVESGGKKNE